MFLKRIVFVWLSIAGMSFLVSGCVHTNLAQVAADYKKPTSQYISEADDLLNNPGQVNRTGAKFRLSPLMVAAILDPKRIVPLLDAGADPTYALQKRSFNHPPGYTALHALAQRHFLYELFWKTRSDLFVPDIQHEIAALDALLKAGADPNAQLAGGRTPLSLLLYYRNGTSLSEPEKAKNRSVQYQLADLLIKHGADPYIKDITKGRSPYKAVMHFPSLNHLEGLFARVDATKEAKLAREQELAAQQKRQQELVAQKKRSIIRQAFAEQADLKVAIASLKELARPCFTLGDAENEIRNFNCGTLINDNYYPSPSCEAYQETLHKEVKRDEEQACAPYRRNVDALAEVFDSNQGLAKREIRQQIGDVSRVASLASHYGSQIRTMDDVRMKEARGQRAAEQRAFQQGMNALISRAEHAFGSKTVADQIIEQGVRDTQRTLHAIGRNRKMAEINASLEAVNSRLESTDKTAVQGDAPKFTRNKLKDSHSVCAGPFTEPAIDEVMSIKERNNAPYNPLLECPEGSRPVQEGAYSPEFTNWQLPAVNTVPAGKGKIRVTRPSFRYECLCSLGGKTGKSSTSQ